MFATLQMGSRQSKFFTFLVIAACITVLNQLYFNLDSEISVLGPQNNQNSQNNPSNQSIGNQNNQNNHVNNPTKVDEKPPLPMDSDYEEDSWLPKEHKDLSLEDDPHRNSSEAHKYVESGSTRHSIPSVDGGDSTIEIPYWDPAKPLPKWYTQTQEFIKRFESEKRPYPFFDKYLFYDTHIWLGLNNIRYMLEMANNMARILERTLIISHRTFARSCSHLEICQAYGKMENIAEITDPFYARWSLDAKSFWDVDGMRETLNIMTSSEFNRVMMVKHGIIVENPDEWIESHGGDLRLPRAFNLLQVYHEMNSSIAIDSRPLLPALYNFDRSAIAMVDDISPLPNKGQLPSKGLLKLQPKMDLYAIREGNEMSVTEVQKQTVPIRWYENKDNNNTGQYGVLPLGFKQFFHSDATILHFQEGVHGFMRFPF
ncbi:hypothetical protein BGX28_010190, partial [Mortierella sp. GBA30]